MKVGTIIYVGAFELPDRNAAAHRVLSNGKILRSLGYDVVFLGVRREDADSGDGIRRDDDYFGFECWSVPYPVGLSAWARYTVGLASVASFLSTSRTPNVVANIFYNYPAIAQLRYSLFSGRLTVLHLADATEWYSAAGGSATFRAAKWLDTFLRMRVVHRLSHGLLTTSRYLTDKYDKANKVTVELPTLFDTSIFAPPAGVAADSCRKFIYVGVPFDAGRLNRRRSNVKERLDTNIRCFSRLYDEGVSFQFSVFGITASQFLDVYPEYEADLTKMSGCVKFHGRRPNKEVMAAVASSDFSVFFRDKTRVTLAGFPSKLAESISCGTPVISNFMLSLEPFSNLEFILLSEQGKEYEVIHSAATMSVESVGRLKTNAFNSRAFDYRGYTARMNAFVDELGI